MTDSPTKPAVPLSEEALAEIEREAERLPTDYNVIEPLLVRDCYEGQEASPWMGHTRPAAEAYASVPGQTVRALREKHARLTEVSGEWASLLDRIRLWSKCADGYPLDEHVNNITAENAALREQLAQTIRERDLAVAHDRQPYPTAEAYEKVCAALNEHKSRLAQVEKSHVCLEPEPLQPSRVLEETSQATHEIPTLTPDGTARPKIS